METIDIINNAVKEAKRAERWQVLNEILAYMNAWQAAGGSSEGLLAISKVLACVRENSQ